MRNAWLQSFKEIIFLWWLIVHCWIIMHFLFSLYPSNDNLSFINFSIVKVEKPIQDLRKISPYMVQTFLSLWMCRFQIQRRLEEIWSLFSLSCIQTLHLSKTQKINYLNNRWRFDNENREEESSNLDSMDNEDRFEI